MSAPLTLGAPVSPALADARLLDAAGHTHALRSMWGQGPALVLFLRHFGCVACSMQVEQMLSRASMLSPLGVRVVFVGSAQPSEIDRFVREEIGDRDVTVLCDPTLAAYRAAGFSRSFSGTFGPRAALGYARATANGFVRRGTRGDLLQQAGSMLVDQSGVVRWFHASRALGDLASLSDAFDVLLPLVAATRGVLA